MPIFDITRSLDTQFYILNAIMSYEKKSKGALSNNIYISPNKPPALGVSIQLVVGHKAKTGPPRELSDIAALFHRFACQFEAIMTEESRAL